MSKRMSWAHGLGAVVLGALATIAVPQASGQTPEAPAVAPEADQPWYYRAAPARVEQKSIAQEKAEQRAAQRMARLAASRWYGINNGRPTASALPFTTMYSHAWQSPGGRPFAWYTSSRPVVILQSAETTYR